VPGSTYWNVGFGRDVGEVLQDEEGIRTIHEFAKNVSWLIKKIFGTTNTWSSQRKEETL
jgi:hypothetical protein